jgi:NTP pyrophosphatase (non-canonical NTP hydrolase)
MKGSGDFSIGSQFWPGASKLIEETGELQQVLGKLIATAGDTKHWEGKDLKERLIEELGDVLGAIRFFQTKNCNLNEHDAIEQRACAKYCTFLKWHGNPEAP